MKIIDALQQRRSYYGINKSIPVSEDRLVKTVEEITELVPDAFNMKSSRVLIVTGQKQDELWDSVYDIFEGNVKREKIDSFKSGYGTILYFIDQKVVGALQEQFPLYADRFLHWAAQSAGMLQISIWTALRELNIGASLQHYNPVIDEKIKALFHIPEHYLLDAQMPFGGITAEPEPKEKEDISLRVRISK